MNYQDEIREVLRRDPENFGALYSLACDFRQSHSYAACFAMADRAIASYEANPVDGEQNHFFELKRLHAQMLRDHLSEIVGPASSMLDPRWKPIFKLGRPRELALCISTHHLPVLPDALNANQLKRLRYLSLTITGNATQTVDALMHGRFETLKALSMSFDTMPDLGLLCHFFDTMRYQFGDIVSFKLSMPRIDDALAISIRNSFGELEYLAFESGERLMTERFGEFLADDPRSLSLMRLGIVGSKIGDNGLFAIFSSENFLRLQALDLHDGNLTNNAARIIVAAHCLPHLRSVDLRYNEIDPAGIDMLSQSQMACKVENQHLRPASAC